ncbi:MAG: hypothetical protein JWP15_2578, partial [Alphaproteobacteria bacterium]|nr:hypothetical protein [Alphaproteobacteria bacterium]
MCNDYRIRVELDALETLVADLRMRLRFPEGRSNIDPRYDVRINERAT